VENNSYGVTPGADGNDFRTERFNEDYAMHAATLEDSTIQPGQHAQNFNKPGSPSLGGIASSQVLIGQTMPGALMGEQDVQEGYYRTPGLASLMTPTIASGDVTPVLNKTESPHKSIKGFPNCVVSHNSLDESRSFAKNWIAPSEAPFASAQGAGAGEAGLWSVIFGAGAAQYNLENCTLNEAGEEVCGESETMTFYTRQITLAAILKSLWAWFTQPNQDPPVCVNSNTAGGCTTCDQDPVPSMCDPDCHCKFVPEGCTPGETGCTEECTTSTDEYACLGRPDTYTLQVGSKVEMLDSNPGLQNIEASLGMILPPNALKEMAGREQLCVTDTLSGEHGDESIGQERYCNKYSGLPEAARQAVTIPGSNKL
jgi:hypothetical protein